VEARAPNNTDMYSLAETVVLASEQEREEYDGDIPVDDEQTSPSYYHDFPSKQGRAFEPVMKQVNDSKRPPVPGSTQMKTKIAERHEEFTPIRSPGPERIFFPSEPAPTVADPDESSRNKKIRPFPNVLPKPIIDLKSRSLDTPEAVNSATDLGTASNKTIDIPTTRGNVNNLAKTLQEIIVFGPRPRAHPPPVPAPSSDVADITGGVGFNMINIRSPLPPIPAKRDLPKPEPQNRNPEQKAHNNKKDVNEDVNEYRKYIRE